MVHQHVITMSFVKPLVPEGGGGGKKVPCFRGHFLPQEISLSSPLWVATEIQPSWGKSGKVTEEQAGNLYMHIPT